jgi:hypothetical protein
MPGAPRVKTKRASRPRRGSAQAILRHVGTWQGDPAEVDQLLAELRRMKEAEVAAKIALLTKQAKTPRPAGNGKGRAAAQRKRRP